MEIDFEKLFKNLAVENSLLVVGALSLLVSIYAHDILGIKIGFFLIMSGGFLRFYNISIVHGLINNRVRDSRYLVNKKFYDEVNGKYYYQESYVIPFKVSWLFTALDFCLCIIMTMIFVCIFSLIILGVM